MRVLQTGRLLYATTALTSVLGFSAGLVSSVHANPLDGNVVSGSATISAPNPTTVQIDQASQNAVINWQSFNIEQGETTRFVQPNANAWTLNRVTGDIEPSRILGTLEANGNVAIINPDGILFGEGARVDVNGLIATTHDIANDDFMAGRFNFTQSGDPAASVVNEGQISIGDYGIGAFVAPGVRNSGVITAKMGSISLASGNAFTLDLYGDNLIHLLVGDEITQEVIDAATGEPVADMVKNEGRISADGGTVALKAATARRAVNSVINNTGVIEANSVGVRNGKITLGAQTASTKTASAPVQRVRVSGVLSATNIPIPTPRPDIEGTGGNIEIAGEMIVASNATIDASGTNGGGTILIGGSYMGGNADPSVLAYYDIQELEYDIPTASYVMLNENVSISADAEVNGDGGKVVVWSDGVAVTAATITARGGAEGGDGGFIETSGKYLEALKAADASAPNGAAGTWLLDPVNIRIASADLFGLPLLTEEGVTTNYGQIFDDFFVQGSFIDQLDGFIYSPTSPSDDTSLLLTSTIEAALNSGTSVQVTTFGTVGSSPGNISLLSDISKTSGGDAFLNLSSVANIFIDEDVDVTSTSGKLHFSLYATQGGIAASNNVGNIDVNGGTFIMEARDAINFSSYGLMPNDTSISLVSSGSPNPYTPVRVEFGPNAEDRIYFLRDNTSNTITFAPAIVSEAIYFDYADDPYYAGGSGPVDLNTPYSIQLNGGAGSGDLHIHLDNIDTLVVEDNAALASNGRDIILLLYGDPNLIGPNENGIPEVTSDGSVFLQYATPGLPVVIPTIEVAGTPTCFGVNCVSVNPLPPVIPIDPTPDPGSGRFRT
ncbi:filamentous hemagglutinin N-terminal domain-containing protein [Mesorhizobium sp.]|uniref:two-partner secretion domain-containing protein n=1 Tax=Mesorhizobium sp. TaxID=1871066 RepID=UPI000FE5BD4F|nr:filamentous hemagglutinin N-terminal domain-containing protein [Mesorhizobium sp.]RWQ58827.1 MAG: filamentous hemagglutinin N-terminal domain-containing protein [Mesorhizobium sp.]